MRSRLTIFAVLAVLVLGAAACAADPPPDQGAAATTAPGPDPTSAPPTTRTAPTRTPRPAPQGVVPAARRQPAPDLQVTDFDGRTITLGGFRGQPLVVNFFESW